jgi:glutamyl-tRNA reductase
MVLGETESLAGKAYDLALQHKHGRASQQGVSRAFNVAKQIPPKPISNGAVSQSARYVELAENFASLKDRQVMVVNRRPARNRTVPRRRAGVIVSNRSHERAVALAAELGGKGRAF